MYSAPLAAVRHRVAVGVPLPFDVFGDDQRELLLARGRMLRNAMQLESLLSRGTTALLDEALEPIEVARHVSRLDLPLVWQQARERLAASLGCCPEAEFVGRLEVSAEQMTALVRRDPDLAIFQALSEPRHGAGDDADAAQSPGPGVLHAMQCAVMALLIARGLRWREHETELAAKVALTMNLSILDHPDLVRGQAIDVANASPEWLSHPLRSRELLEQAGVTDRSWLLAVERHHEREDGSGFPAGVEQVPKISALVRCAGAFIAGFVGHTADEDVTADKVFRAVYQSERGNPYVAALVREAGLYPPGSAVTLATGETAVVVKRGRSIQAPLVAAMLNRFERAFDCPIPRDTSERGLGIVRGLPRGRFRPSREQLSMALQGFSTGGVAASAH
ncbi:MAG: hypothetical protein KJS95_08925 [Gammaproteobacteria bacterium]|nr:hypothetical protein [Gammaproteobacteria bacterium]